MTPRLISVVRCTIFTDEMRCGVVWCVVWSVVMEQHRDVPMTELCFAGLELPAGGGELRCLALSRTPLIMSAGSSHWPHQIIYIVTLRYQIYLTIPPSIPSAQH